MILLKNDIVKLREALNQKILRLNALESAKCNLVILIMLKIFDVSSLSFV